MTLYLHMQTTLLKRQPLEKLQEGMTRWNESFNRYNLKLNLKKTEVLVVSRTEKEAVVTLDEYQLNQVTKFKYLGCITGSKGQIDEEINGRISKMSQNVGMMYRLLKYRHVPKKAKLLIHITILRPILMNGHESWILTKKLKSKITAAEMKVLRLVKGVTRRDRVYAMLTYMTNLRSSQSLRLYRQIN